MSLPAPIWHSLFLNVAKVDTTKARNDLSSYMRHVEQNDTRIILTTYGHPRGALVSLRDIALLELLKNDPGLLKKLKARMQT